MRRITIGIVAGLLLFNVHHAQAFDEKGGNALWGKYAIQTCRSCHKEKGLSGLAPEEKSAAEWESFFVDKYKKLRDMNHDFSSMGINERQLENVHRYLVEESGKKGSGNSAAGNDSPKTIEATTKKMSPSPEGSKSEGESGGVFNPAAGDSTKGRYVFRKCLTCHKKNSGKIISPADRTIVAWDRYFADDFKKFKKEMPKFDTYGFTVTQMEDLHKFVQQYALDAQKPKTCE
jgi:cytochrome c2